MSDRRVGRRRTGFWATLALPGVAWLCIFFLVPFYVILGVAFGTVDPIFGTPQPAWNPLEWNTQAFDFVFDGLFSSGGSFQAGWGVPKIGSTVPNATPRMT